jgi:hypothetical protein
MEIRLTKLEAIIPTLATKEDLVKLEGKVFGAIHKLEATIHQEMNRQTWRLVTTMISVSTALATATFFMARYVN